MADNLNSPMTHAEYEAQIMQHSLEALERSYRLLKETNALLTAQPPQASGPSQTMDQTKIPNGNVNSCPKGQTRVP